MPNKPKLRTMAEKTEKRKRFKRLAEKRTNRVLERLDILSNCANRSNYKYTEKEVNKIFREINKKVKNVKTQFKVSKGKDDKDKFEL